METNIGFYRIMSRVFKIKILRSKMSLTSALYSHTFSKILNRFLPSDNTPTNIAANKINSVFDRLSMLCNLTIVFDLMFFIVRIKRRPR